MKNSYEILEYHKLLNKLIDKSILETTKEEFIDLELFKSKSLLDEEFSLLENLIDFYKYDNGFELMGISNIERYLKPIRILGNYLEIEDIYIIKKNLKIFRIQKSRAKNVKDKYKNIWNIFKEIDDLKDLESNISEYIDDNGDIKDEATINLRDIRFQKKNLIFNINDKLNGLINGSETSKAIQDKIITIRNDRYVISVKTDFKGLIKGIEHDRSASGSTCFIEPLNIVSLNNKLREYELREKEEIRKIQIRLTELIREKINEFENVVILLKRLDFLNAKVIFSIENDAKIPKVSSNIRLSLIEARHPLINKDKVVPLNIELNDDENIMLITGPNTGGKTVTLKVAGLLTLMALSGIPVTASEKSIIGFFDDVYSDLGDEQSLEQNLSSFSSHVISLEKILKNSTSKSLILLDELGSGTDPLEGSAFAMSIIDELLEKKSKTLITTHYSALKAYAYNNTGIKSASMEFNSETFNPTYKLLIGIPGKSNALIIAQKYGINEKIIDRARAYISEDNKKVEKMISDIKLQSDLLESQNMKLKILEEELESQKKSFKEKLFELEIEKKKILEKAYSDAQNYVRDIQNKAKSLVDKINKENIEKEEAKNLQKNINMISRYIEENKKKDIVKTKIKKTVDFKEGDEVLVKSLNQNGIILRLLLDKNALQVKVGILKVIVEIDNVTKIEKKPIKTSIKSVINNVKQVDYKIDLRGKFAEEAIEELDIYLNRALLSGYNSVTVIHGKGTMVLRKKIHEYLKNCKIVKEFVNAHPNEGGLGATIVTLK